MMTPLERGQNLLTDLRLAQVDFNAIFTGKNNLTPLEAVEQFLLAEQELRIRETESSAQTACVTSGREDTADL